MLTRWLTEFDEVMTGWPSLVLTILLLAIALVLVIVALRGSNRAKAVTFLWAVFP